MLQSTSTATYRKRARKTYPYAHDEFIRRIRTGKISLRNFPGFTRSFFIEPDQVAHSRFKIRFDRESSIVKLLWDLRKLFYYLGIIFTTTYFIKNGYYAKPLDKFFFFCAEAAFFISYKYGRKIKDPGISSVFLFSPFDFDLKEFSLIFIAISLVMKFPHLFLLSTPLYLLFFTCTVTLPYLCGMMTYSSASKYLLDLAGRDKFIFLYLCDLGMFSDNSESFPADT